MQCVNGSASQTSWTDQLDGPAGQTSSFYLEPWPVRIFKDFRFSLYIVAASESDEGIVCLDLKIFWQMIVAAPTLLLVFFYFQCQSWSKLD